MTVADTTQDLVRVKAQITLRELAVLSLMAEGFTNAEISEQLLITVRTVKHHSASVRRKLGARTPAHAVALGYRLGLLSVPPALSHRNKSDIP